MRASQAGQQLSTLVGSKRNVPPSRSRLARLGPDSFQPLPQRSLSPLPALALPDRRVTH